MDQWEQWANNIRQASGMGSGNIYQDYAVAGRVNASPAAITGRKAAIDADNEERKRKEEQAIAAKNKELEEKVKADATDPSKAQMRLNPDGKGYFFLDGTGKQININQYSMLTGKRPDEILENSADPRDQQFVQDYRTMRDISNAWVNGDNATLAKYRQADPEKFNQLVNNYKSPAEMVNAFVSYYDDYYGSGGSKDRTTFSPSPGAGAEDIKIGKRNFGAPTMDQTMAPIEQKPRDLNFWEKLNPFAGQRDELKRYEERKRANPWSSYFDALYYGR